MDVLSDILSQLELRTTRYFRVQVGGPWGVEVPAEADVVRFHIVLSGACTVEVGPEHARLGRGDIALVPRGRAHGLADAEGRPLEPLAEVLAGRPVDEAGILALHPKPDVELLCGHMAFASQRHPLLTSLPDHITVRGGEGSWLPALIEGLWGELEARAPGSDAVIDRLVEVVLIRALRELAHADTPLPFALALSDAPMARALNAIHREPAREWDVRSLAKVAALSRTAFHERFRATVGVAPGEYLTRWRMELAARHLAREPTASVGEVGERVGYRSQAAFSRAYRRHHGVPPSAARAARAEPGAQVS